MELNRAVAENIKRIRKSKKLSMERLAAEAGVSRSMLGQHCMISHVISA